MTALDERTVPAPDDDTPADAEPRPAGLVRQGWHVQVDGRWLLVTSADRIRGGVVALVFSSGALLTIGPRAPLWTRTPAEQIAHISALLPARDHYRPTGHLATPFGGIDD